MVFWSHITPKGNTGVVGEQLRRDTVDGLPVLIVDNLLPGEQIKRLFNWLHGSAFTRSEAARPDTQAFLHWAFNVPPEECRRLPLYYPALNAISQHLPERGAQRLYRSYCNLSTYGDMLFTHTDAKPGEQGLTALWYIAPQWDTEWGGETLLFDASGDPVVVIGFKPGRLALFDGSILHAGRPPNRICVMPRLTFALKFAPEEASSR